VTRSIQQQQAHHNLEQNGSKFLPETLGRVVWPFCLLWGRNTLISRVKSSRWELPRHLLSRSPYLLVSRPRSFSQSYSQSKDRRTAVCWHLWEVIGIVNPFRLHGTMSRRTGSEEAGGGETPEYFEAVDEDEEDAPAQSPDRKPWLKVICHCQHSAEPRLDRGYIPGGGSSSRALCGQCLGPSFHGLHIVWDLN